PLSSSWGIENRTTAIRVIPGGKATRVEYRQTAADLNHYTAIATCLASGLHGIEHAIDPGPPSQGEARADQLPLPRTLREATELLQKSEAARVVLGEAFVDHYVRTRDWEVRQYERAVTDWELKRYFEGV